MNLHCCREISRTSNQFRRVKEVCKKSPRQYSHPDNSFKSSLMKAYVKYTKISSDLQSSLRAALKHVTRGGIRRVEG